MASALRGRGAVYDVRPSGEYAYGGPFGGLIGFVIDALRGGCAGLLALLGGSHITGTAAPLTAPAGFESLTGLLQNISAGGLTGPVEILGGAALYLTARRTIARTLGLLLFIGFITAYANGYSTAEILTALSKLLSSAAGAVDSIAGGESV